MVPLDPELDEMDDPHEMPGAVTVLHDALLELTASQLRSRRAAVDHRFDVEVGRITAADGRVHVDYSWEVDRGAHGVSALAALLHARTIMDWWTHDASALLRNLDLGIENRRGEGKPPDADEAEHGEPHRRSQPELARWRQDVAVQHASAVDAQTIRLLFSDGLAGDVDLREYLESFSICVLARDPVAFSRLRASEDGSTIEWESGERWAAADLYYRLLRSAAPVAADELVRADLAAGGAWADTAMSRAGRDTTPTGAHPGCGSQWKGLICSGIGRIAWLRPTGRGPR